MGTSLWVVAACTQGGSQPESTGTGPTVTLAVPYEPATAEPPEGPAAWPSWDPGPMDPGTYEPTNFQPTVRFTIGGAGSPRLQTA